MIGRVIGNYQIVSKLGAGGMGTVYRALDQAVERNVAIKVVRVDSLAPGTPGTQPVDRFKAEARTMAKLNHPAIATLYAFHTEGEECFLVMEYVPGRNLAQVIESRGALGWREACEILLRVLSGLQHAHAQGIVHRDLKPANVLLGNDGSVKITDFGIALMQQGPRLTADQGVVGTLEYIAPERLRGRDASPSSDLYSAGIVLYEALTGRLPFSHSASYQLIRAHVEQPAIPPSQLGADLPPSVEQVLLGVLAKDPAERPADAVGLARKLRASMLEADPALQIGSLETPAFPQEWLAAKQTVVLPAAPLPVAAAKETIVVAAAAKETSVLPAPPQRNRTLLFAGVGGAAIVLAVAGYLLFGRSPEPVTPPDKAEPPSIPVAVSPVAPPPAPAPVTPTPVEPTPPAPKPAPPQETAAIATLADVQSIFVRAAPGRFETLLAEQIEDKLKGSLQIAAGQASADAVLSVVFKDEKGKTLRNSSGDLEDLDGTITATATLRARQGNKVLWSGEANDKRGLVGGFGNKQERLASRLAERLRDAR